MPAQSPEDHTLVARIAAHESWARTTDRAGRTEAARRAFRDRFERQVPAEITDPVARERAAENLRKAFYTRLALRSAQSRRKSRGGAAA
ncbi:MAG: hypothetical protein ACRDRL_10660 [Sciscionella sp.]